jgi:hypothetical protein
MVRYERDAAGNITSDGSFSLYKKRNSDADAEPEYSGGFNIADTDGTSDDDVLVKTVPIRVIVTGDLAFYAIVLGMENHSGSWCWLCLLSKAQWEVEGHDMGEPTAGITR